jgi:ribosome-associated protein
MDEVNMTEPVDVARRAVEISSEHQASDVVLLDLTPLNAFADYFVILSAESARQISALTDALAQGLKESGGHLRRQEGTPNSGWVLLDFSNVVVHVFALEEREYYQLEDAWSEAIPLVRIQ